MLLVMKSYDDQETILALKAIINKGERDRKNTKKQACESKKKSAMSGKDKPKWKTVPPKSGEPMTKVNNSKNYHWCPNHKEWTIHAAAECHGVKKLSTPAAAEASGPKKNSNNNQAFKMQVLQMIAEMGSDSESCTSP